VPLIMGSVGMSKALRPIVGRNHSGQGWTRRPVFSGGRATDEAIRLTVRAPLRHLPGRPLGLELDWMKQPPRHHEELRRGNYLRFLSAGGEPPLPDRRGSSARLPHARSG